MVYHMRCPKEAVVVRDAVRPIAAEIVTDKTDDQGPPIQFHTPRQLIVDPNGPTHQSCF